MLWINCNYKVLFDYFYTFLNLYWRLGPKGTGIWPTSLSQTHINWQTCVLGMCINLLKKKSTVIVKTQYLSFLICLFLCYKIPCCTVSMLYNILFKAITLTVEPSVGYEAGLWKLSNWFVSVMFSSGHDYGNELPSRQCVGHDIEIGRLMSYGAFRSCRQFQMF